MIQLMKQQLKISSFGVIIWTVIIFVMFIISALVFPQIKEQGEQMEKMINNIDVIKSLIGTFELTDYGGFMISKNYTMLPFLLSFYVVTIACQMVAREIDNGSIEYTLALPIKRISYLMSKIIVMAINLLFIHLVAIVAVWLGGMIVQEPVVISDYLTVTLISWLLTFLLGTIVTFISLFINDYTKALISGFSLVLFLYILDAFLQISTLSEKIQFINPFYHFQANELFKGTTTISINIIYLSALTFLFLILNIIVFNKKQINP